VLAHAVVQPHAVVVEFIAAPVATATVLTIRQNNELAYRALQGQPLIDVIQLIDPFLLPQVPLVVDGLIRGVYYCGSEAIVE